MDHFKSLLNLLQYCFCFIFSFYGHEPCGIPVPQLGIELIPLALKSEVLTTDNQGSPQDLFLLVFCWESKRSQVPGVCRRCLINISVVACNAGDPDLIPGSGRSPGEGNGNPF